MKKQWERLAARFQAYPLRQRSWIAVMLLLTVLVVGYVMTLEPELKRQQKLKRQIAEQDAQARTAEDQLQALQCPVLLNIFLRLM